MRSLIFLVICSITLLVMPVRLYAQLQVYGNVVPPSPRSVEFEKFINYKISLSNGLPDIGINFYTVEVDNVKIPIGISYHASGIKFGQSNGDVGLGWSLTSAYRVSRTVYGRVDEIYNMPDMNNVSGGMAIQNYLNNNFSSPYDRDLYLARYVNPREQAFVTASQNDYMDGQFDVFTLGLPSQSGNFIISDRVNKVVTMLNNSALKLNYTTGAIGIDGFNVTDQDGVKYRMGQNEANGENLQISSGGVMKKYSTAWMVTDITTPLNNIASFRYQPFQEVREGTAAYSRTIMDGASYEHMENGNQVSCYMGTDNAQTSTGSSSVYNTSLLSSISGVNENVTINRNSNGTTSNIEIRKKNNALIMKIVFSYSQYGNRVFLDAVDVHGDDGFNNQHYSFDYESKDATMNYYDNYGYYQTSNLQGYEPQIGWVSYYQDPCNSIPSQINLSGSDKSVYSTSSAYTLKKITYPTGGSTSYTFEGNRYKFPGGNPVNAGGLRVSSISSDSGTGQPILQRQFSYGDQGSGTLFFNLNDPQLYMKEQIIPVFCHNYIGGANALVALTYRTVSSGLDGDLADSYVRDNLGWYGEVREDFGQGIVDHQFTMPYNGLQVNSFLTNQTYDFNWSSKTVASPTYFIKGYHFWNKPVIENELTYAKLSGGSLKLKKKENFTYYIPNPEGVNNEYLGLKVTTFAKATNSPSLPPSQVYEYTKINSVFNYDTYTITSGDVLLKSKTIYDYDNLGNETKVDYNYSYTTGNLISEEKMSASNTELLTTKFKYSSDFKGITAVDSFSSGIKNLQIGNIISPVIEKSTFRSNLDGTNSRLVSSTMTAYKTDLPLPDKIFEVEAAFPTVGFAMASVQSGIMVKDTSYKEKISIDSYNNKGKILSVSAPFSPAICYLWGYNNQYPVAKVLGSDYATVSGLINQSVLDNPSGDQQLRTELNNIRTSLPDAQVTTFTYNPLVGMTSQTDAKGQTTYYEYDEFQRLKTIKDQNGNILKQTDYHYKN